MAVIKTDTIYGLVGQAKRPATVSRIYELKKRQRSKPLIVLIGGVADLNNFGVVLTTRQEKIVKHYWPGPVSLIFAVAPWQQASLAYLHCGTGKIAFRLPAEANLQALLAQVGPLVAPSANPEGEPPATNIEEARHYFGDGVDYYEDGGLCLGQASKLIDLTGAEEKILRA